MRKLSSVDMRNESTRLDPLRQRLAEPEAPSSALPPDLTPASWEAVVAELLGPMLVVARRLCRTEEQAQEAVQEAFTAVFRTFVWATPWEGLRPWLHRLTVDASLAGVIRQERESEEGIERMLPRFSADGHAESPWHPWPMPADDAVSLRDSDEMVRCKIDELPDTYRTVLVLRDVEGASAEFTAEVLGLSLELVASRLHLARQALRQLLDGVVRSNWGFGRLGMQTG